MASVLIHDILDNLRNLYLHFEFNFLHLFDAHLFQFLFVFHQLAGHEARDAFLELKELFVGIDCHKVLALLSLFLLRWFSVDQILLSGWLRWLLLALNRWLNIILREPLMEAV